MKTLVFRNSSGVLVELLTDLIGDNSEFTIYQVQHKDPTTNLMVLGYGDTLIAAGWDFRFQEYNLGDVIAFAQQYGYTITAVEVGKTDIVIYQGTYYGGAIGVDLLDSYMY